MWYEYAFVGLTLAFGSGAVEELLPADFNNFDNN